MSETYCGKDCSACARKESQNCPGCTAVRDCEIARCCRERGHKSCETCSFNNVCGKLSDREQQAEHREKRRLAEEQRKEAELKRKEALVNKAEILGKGLSILFWLFIPDLISGILSTEELTGSAAGLHTTGLILRIVCSVAYGLILLKLSSEDYSYHSAGICLLISAAADAVSVMITGNSEPKPWLILIALPAAIVGFAGEYNEFMGHASVLSEINNELSDAWEVLWKKYFCSMLLILGGTVLALIAPVLGSLAMIAGSIGVIVYGIKKLIYLYRSANMMKRFVMSEK